jgi:hypothetical protein
LWSENWEMLVPVSQSQSMHVISPEEVRIWSPFFPMKRQHDRYPVWAASSRAT